MIIGILPSSKSTPTLVVDLWTPRMFLQNRICRFSIGLFTGSFRHPQRSLEYISIGLISVSNNFVVSSICVVKQSPSLCSDSCRPSERVIVSLQVKT